MTSFSEGEIRVGYEREFYVVGEGMGIITLCAVVENFDATPRQFTLNVTTSDRSAG